MYTIEMLLSCCFTACAVCSICYLFIDIQAPLPLVFSCQQVLMSIRSICIKPLCCFPLLDRCMRAYLHRAFVSSAILGVIGNGIPKSRQVHPALTAVGDLRCKLMTLCPSNATCYSPGSLCKACLAVWSLPTSCKMCTSAF